MSWFHLVQKYNYWYFLTNLLEVDFCGDGDDLGVVKRWPRYSGVICK